MDWLIDEVVDWLIDEVVNWLIDEVVHVGIQPYATNYSRFYRWIA